MSGPLLVAFVGGTAGRWNVERMNAVAGEPLQMVTHVDVREGDAAKGASGTWVLRGATSHERYVTRAEHEQLASREPALGRPTATRAALIPIRKSARWWALSQDERRAIFEERSRHIATGLEYLPRVGRRLHHARDLGEPFDFLTWFEFAPDDAPAFEALVDRLRASEEWRYVEREIDIRLGR